MAVGKPDDSGLRQRNVGVPAVPEAYITEHGREQDKKLEEHQE
jgi:hypothetical protein